MPFTDTQRVVSLAFSNLDGPDSVRNCLARNGNRDYEPAIYRPLGQVYLGQSVSGMRQKLMFVQVYPDSTLALEFSSLQIEAYQKGGFPTLVLPAKRSLSSTMASTAITGDATRTFANSMYRCSRDIFLTWLNTTMFAQQSGKPADYREPARWYQEYLNTPPASEDQGKVNHRYAEVLYAAEDYATAISAERTAYQYPDYERGRRRLQCPGCLPENSRRQSGRRTGKRLAEKKIASAQQYGQRFPAHPEVPNVLHDTAEDQLALGDVKVRSRPPVFWSTASSLPSQCATGGPPLPMANSTWVASRWRKWPMANCLICRCPSSSAACRKNSPSAFTARLSSSRNKAIWILLLPSCGWARQYRGGAQERRIRCRHPVH